MHQFRYYKTLAEKTFEQLTDDQLFWQYNPESNSIAVIVKHMWGNMHSRWTDFLTTDGEKEWRQREAEFDNDTGGRGAMMHHWHEGWNCLFDALESLTPDDLERTVYIRNQPLSVIDAITRQVAHYAHHVGQIVYIGKMLAGSGWNSLSIPRGGTSSYNAAMISSGKKG